MTIQPGNGYNLVSSSQGTSLDIDKSWAPPIGDAMVFAPEFVLGGTSNLPEQLVYGEGTGGRPSPFECQIVSINGQRFLQIGVGAIGYTSGPMPLIKAGAETRIMQAYANKVQICPSGTRTYGDLYPIYPYDDPSYSLTWWMEDGGGYQLADTNDPLTLWAFKWDVDVGVAPFSTSTVVNTGLPTLALIAASNSADTNKVAVDPGPSIFVQTMNVQKMTGYDHASTGLTGDWGHCHTSWLNPVKLGYSYKAIATITASANTFAMVGGIERAGIPLVQNQVQHISLIGKASGGSAYISCGAGTSTIPFPVTTFWDPVAPIYSDELTLANCLNSIPGITFTIDGEPVTIGFTGNVEVSRTTEGSYYVTFCNELAGLNPPLLTFNTAGVTAYTYDFDITQYHTGNIDLTTPMQTGMVQLRNVSGADEAADPYNVNFAADWDQIVNKAECVACDGFTGDVVTAGMTNMTGASTIPVDYSIVGGCVNEPYGFDHPYKVYLMSSGGGSNVWAIVTGSTNNVTPGNITSTITLGAGTYDVWIRHPYLSPNFPDATNFGWAIGATIPADTDTDGYVLIATISGTTVTQIVTGSLWADRLKLGATTAQYFFARV
jgi:hypothetical protein